MAVFGLDVCLRNDPRGTPILEGRTSPSNEDNNQQRHGGYQNSGS